MNFFSWMFIVLLCVWICHVLFEILKPNLVTALLRYPQEGAQPDPQPQREAMAIPPESAGATTPLRQ